MPFICGKHRNKATPQRSAFLGLYGNGEGTSSLNTEQPPQRRSRTRRDNHNCNIKTCESENKSVRRSGAAVTQFTAARQEATTFAHCVMCFEYKDFCSACWVSCQFPRWKLLLHQLQHVAGQKPEPAQPFCRQTVS